MRVSHTNNFSPQPIDIIITLFLLINGRDKPDIKSCIEIHGIIEAIELIRTKKLIR